MKKILKNYCELVRSLLTALMPMCSKEKLTIIFLFFLRDQSMISLTENKGFPNDTDEIVNPVF